MLRKICAATSNTLFTSSEKALAEPRSWPNGFSMTTRTHLSEPFSWPLRLVHAMLKSREKRDDVREKYSGANRKVRRCDCSSQCCAWYPTPASLAFSDSVGHSYFIEVHRVVMNALAKLCQFGIRGIHSAPSNDAFPSFLPAKLSSICRRFTANHGELLRQ